MHDYRPEWDHEVFDTPEKAVLPLKALLDRIGTEMSPVLGVPVPEVFFTHLDGLVGMYVDGTSSRPVIGIDHQKLDAACRMLVLDYERQLAVTIAHGMAQAFQETIDPECRIADGAERFARRWADEGVVDVMLLRDQEQVEC